MTDSVYREKIRVVSDIREIYGEGPEYQKNAVRYQSLTRKFVEIFEREPEFFVRAPGRVNLIGEHIDYEGYNVFPMAIDKDIVMAIRVENSTDASVKDFPRIYLHNLDPAFDSCVIEGNPLCSLDDHAHGWTKYFRCAYRGVFDHTTNGGKRDLLKGIKGKEVRIVASGTIPKSSGLSSSSALVVASSLATICALSLAFSPQEIAETCQKSEQFIGVMGGGMDQAVSCLGVRGMGAVLQFHPQLRDFPILLPFFANEGDDALTHNKINKCNVNSSSSSSSSNNNNSDSRGATIVVANSLAEAEKAVSGATHYNRRVVECMLAARVLAKELGMQKWTEVTTLREVQDHAQKSLAEMRELLPAHLHSEAYSRQELEDYFGVQLTELHIIPRLKLALERVVAAAQEYKLYQRAHHVYSEAERVEKFRAICTSATGSSTGEGSDLLNNCSEQSSDDNNVDPNAAQAGSDTDYITALGQILNESHKSCRDDYDCSCSELDELTTICLESGAVGSRLTGAGWGGCTVSLVPNVQLDSFLANVWERYFDSRAQKSEKDTVLFPALPCGGICVYKGRT